MRRILNEISKIGNEGKYVFSGGRDSILAPFRNMKMGNELNACLWQGGMHWGGRGNIRKVDAECFEKRGISVKDSPPNKGGKILSLLL
jgi:hypothetical protein